MEKFYIIYSSLYISKGIKQIWEIGLYILKFFLCYSYLAAVLLNCIIIIELFVT